VRPRPAGMASAFVIVTFGKDSDLRLAQGVAAVHHPREVGEGGMGEVPLLSRRALAQISASPACL